MVGEKPARDGNAEWTSELLGEQAQAQVSETGAPVTELRYRRHLPART